MTRLLLLKILLILAAGASAVFPIQHLLEQRTRKPAAPADAAPAKSAVEPAPDRTAAPAATPADPSAKTASSGDPPPAVPDAKEAAPATTAAPKPAPAPSPAHRNYVVKEGDSLWSIAEKELGSGKYANKLIDANRGRIDPNNLKVGQVLVIPDVNADAPRFR
jgi:nucleoid-associated protein YgaU